MTDKTTSTNPPLAFQQVSNQAKNGSEPTSVMPVMPGWDQFGVNNSSVFDTVLPKTNAFTSLHPLSVANKAKNKLLTAIERQDIFSHGFLLKANSKANELLESLDDSFSAGDYRWLLKAEESKLTPPERLMKFLLQNRRKHMRMVASSTRNRPASGLSMFSSDGNLDTVEF